MPEAYDLKIANFETDNNVDVEPPDHYLNTITYPADSSALIVTPFNLKLAWPNSTSNTLENNESPQQQVSVMLFISISHDDI